MVMFRLKLLLLEVFLRMLNQSQIESTLLMKFGPSSGFRVSLEAIWHVRKFKKLELRARSRLVLLELSLPQALQTSKTSMFRYFF